MFSKAMQLSLAMTSISPILLIFWFKEFSKNWNIENGFYFLLLAIILFSLSYFLIKIANSKLKSIPVKVSTISNVNDKSIVFIFFYILPLFNISISIFLFLLFVFFVMIFITNIYYFHPFLRLLGYHYYIITVENGVSYILISKKIIRNPKQVNHVVQLSDYVLLEKGSGLPRPRIIEGMKRYSKA